MLRHAAVLTLVLRCVWGSFSGAWERRKERHETALVRARYEDVPDSSSGIFADASASTGFEPSAAGDFGRLYLGFQVATFVVALLVAAGVAAFFVYYIIRDKFLKQNKALLLVLLGVYFVFLVVLLGSGFASSVRNLDLLEKDAERAATARAASESTRERESDGPVFADEVIYDGLNPESFDDDGVPLHERTGIWETYVSCCWAVLGFVFGVERPYYQRLHRAESPPAVVVLVVAPILFFIGLFFFSKWLRAQCAKLQDRLRKKKGGVSTKGVEEETGDDELSPRLNVAPAKVGTAPLGAKLRPPGSPAAAAAPRGVAHTRGSFGEGPPGSPVAGSSDSGTSGQTDASSSAHTSPVRSAAGAPRRRSTGGRSSQTGDDIV